MIMPLSATVQHHARTAEAIRLQPEVCDCRQLSDLSWDTPCVVRTYTQIYV